MALLSEIPARALSLDAAVEQIYSETRSLVCAYLLYLGVPTAQAQDVTQEVFLRLYQTMRKAYDEGTAKGWPFQNELYYESTVFDAGRAYSLFRPTDPEYGDIAALAVDIATQLHYDPLSSDDASLWYVLEASNFEVTNGDETHRPLAQAPGRAPLCGENQNRQADQLQDRYGNRSKEDQYR